MKKFINLLIIQRSGILEWCVKTTPLGLYLTGMQRKIGAHKKYYPNDISIVDCREAMKVINR